MNIRNGTGILCFLLFLWIVLTPCRALSLEATVSFPGPTNPSISRFVGFTAVIPAAAAKGIDVKKIRLFINGEDQTHRLQIEYDAHAGNFFLAFHPSRPLPLGKVVEKLLTVDRDGNILEKQWTIVVDPSADPALAPYCQAIKRKPNDYEAHFRLAKEYQKKYLLEDAATEFLRVLQLRPDHPGARAAYERIFSLWDNKSITVEKVTVNIARESALEKMGRLLLFNVIINNRSKSQVKFDPENVTLLLDDEEQKPALSTLKGYARQAYEHQLINLEDYARFSYFLDTHPINLLPKVAIQPGDVQAGYLAYEIETKKYRSLILKIKLRVGKKTASYRFPFAGD